MYVCAFNCSRVCRSSSEYNHTCWPIAQVGYNLVCCGASRVNPVNNSRGIEPPNDHQTPVSCHNLPFLTGRNHQDAWKHAATNSDELSNDANIYSTLGWTTMAQISLYTNLLGWASMAHFSEYKPFIFWAEPPWRFLKYSPLTFNC